MVNSRDGIDFAMLFTLKKHGKPEDFRSCFFKQFRKIILEMLPNTFSKARWDSSGKVVRANNKAKPPGTDLFIQKCRQEWSQAEFAKIELAFLTRKGKIETQFLPARLILLWPNGGNDGKIHWKIF